jgi:hypothetical protein
MLYYPVEREKRERAVRPHYLQAVSPETTLRVVYNRHITRLSTVWCILKENKTLYFKKSFVFREKKGSHRKRPCAIRR